MAACSARPALHRPCRLRRFGDELGATQRLAHIDVAEPGDARLVHQERLHVALGLAAAPRQVVDGERGLERIDAEHRQLGRRRRVGRGVGAQDAEAARIDVAQLEPLAQREDRVGVRRARRVGVGEDEPPGHAEVAEQHAAPVRRDR